MVGGACTTTTARLEGSGTYPDYNNPITVTSSSISSRTRDIVENVGSTEYHYIGNVDGVLYQAPRKRTGDTAWYKFDEIYTKISTSTSVVLHSDFTDYPSPVLSYDDGAFFDQQPAWVIKSPQNKTGLVGFGAGFNTTAPIYKSLTMQSSGQTWDESNLPNTNNLTANIEFEGPQAIHTGCQLPHGATMSWSAPTDTDDTKRSHTESTLLATYSSTVVRNLAGGGSTSTRSDKFATYTFKLAEKEDSPNTYEETFSYNFFLLDYDTILTTNAQASPSPILTINLGRDNTFNSKQTLYLRSGLDITSTKISSDGVSSSYSTRLTATNATITQELDFFGQSIIGTFSMYSMDIPQGIGIQLEAEILYQYGRSGLQFYQDVIPYVSNAY